MLHLKTFRTRSIGWVLFEVNFRPLQEIEAIMGEWADIWYWALFRETTVHVLYMWNVMHIARDQRTKVVRGSCILEYYSHMCSWLLKATGEEKQLHTHAQQTMYSNFVWLGPSIKEDTLSFRRCWRNSKRCPKSSFMLPDSVKIADCGVTHDQFVTHCKKITLSLLLGTILPSSKTNHQHFMVLTLNRKLICIDWRMASRIGSHTTSVSWLLEDAKSLGTRTLSKSLRKRLGSRQIWHASSEEHG